MIYLQQAALQQSAEQLPSEQFPFSQHLESGSQQAVVQTQFDEPQRQADELFEVMAYIVPAAINNRAVPRTISFFFIFFVKFIFLYPCLQPKTILGKWTICKLLNEILALIKQVAYEKGSHIKKTIFLR